ncbi:CDP-alcohol phosphatidyltransferase family protein [Latilactobacillus curvatus]|uniref:CDP-alcohol phosphatidyltransferase family protein n=1 Tax=Latilactobacillus curvatus TaxID=28038 RepID=UPI0020C79F4F|nr:CDP-alcohol phosphatidyltransferase family protein [Latilactobacillus curvatus]MCP8850481.1 CDP-alcohol phosphatidyltransferase family protein [Latilactobacillus curvatus]
MEYSLKQIIDSRTPHKKYIDKLDVWVFLVVRPLSNLLTWFFLKLRLSANISTAVSTIIGTLGAFLIMIPSTKFTLSGLILINFWIVFDCIDGNIARTTRTSSKMGEFFDGVSGYIFLSLLYLSIGVNVYNNYSLEISNVDFTWLYIAFGSITSMSCILPRLIDNKAKTMFSNYSSDVSNKDGYSIIYIIGLNIAGVAGLANPLLLVAYFTGKLNLYLVVYFVIQTGIGFLSVYKTMRGIVVLNNEGE